MDRRDRNVLLLGILVILVLVVGYYFLLLSPLRAEYDARVQERSGKEAQLAQLEQEVAQLEQIQSDAPDIERQLLEYSKRIPEQPQIPALIIQIKEISQAAGVTQLSIVPGIPEPPPGGGDFTRIPITMSFEGTYEQLQRFFFLLRNLSRLVTVNEFTYEPVGGEGTTGEGTTAEPGIERALQVEIQAEVYVQPNNVPVLPAPAPQPAAPEETSGGTARVR